MRQSRYLNVILTANAVLLGGLLWTRIADRPLLVETAVAQARERPNDFTPPNSAELRKRQLDELKAIRKSIDELGKLVRSGKMKVEISNIDALRSEAPAD